MIRRQLHGIGAKGSTVGSVVGIYWCLASPVTGAQWIAALFAVDVATTAVGMTMLMQRTWAHPRFPLITRQDNLEWLKPVVGLLIPFKIVSLLALTVASTLMIRWGGDLRSFGIFTAAMTALCCIGPGKE